MRLRTSSASRSVASAPSRCGRVALGTPVGSVLQLRGQIGLPYAAGQWAGAAA